MSKAGRKIIAGLQEFARKLKSGVPIHGTRVVRCECRGSGCPKCQGRGYYSRRVTLK